MTISKRITAFHQSYGSPSFIAMAVFPLSGSNSLFLVCDRKNGKYFLHETENRGQGEWVDVGTHECLALRRYAQACLEAGWAGLGVCRG